MDPSGSYFSWKASAMGKNVSNAKTFLEKRYLRQNFDNLALMLLEYGMTVVADLKNNICD